MIQIRPVSDLRNKFSEIERTVKGGQPIYLTKNGYGTMIIMSLEKYAELTNDVLPSPHDMVNPHIQTALSVLSDGAEKPMAAGRKVPGTGKG